LSRIVCIVGLGNPGPKYRGTRHNIGFEWVDAAVTHLDSRAKFKEKFESEWVCIDTDSTEFHFLKPLTFMNESGRALSKWLDSHQGESKILVVYDEMDLNVGRIRLRYSGSDGGHRGIRSIIERLGTQNVPRLRIGIGRPVSETVDFVLSRFTPDERKILNDVLLDVPAVLEIFAREDEAMALNWINALKYGGQS